MNFRVIISICARGTHEIKRHYEIGNRFRQDWRYKVKFLPEAMRGKDVRFFYGNRLVSEREIYMNWEFTEMDQNWLVFHDV